MDALQIADIYRRYYKMVLSRARRLVDDEATDVMQDVFEKFVKRPPQEDKITAWLIVTTNNMCRNRLRNRYKRDKSWKKGMETTLYKTSEPNELLQNKDLCRKLLSALSKKHLDVAILVYVDGISQSRAAKLLNIDRGTVATRLSQIRKKAQRLVKK